MVVPTGGVNQLAGKVAEQSLKEGAGKQQQASTDDQARLQDALQNKPQDDLSKQDPQALGSVQNQQPVPAVDKATAAERPASLGDTILQSMDKMRTETADMGHQVSSIDNMETMSPQELLKTQLQVSRVMFNEQAIGTATGKIEQDMDTLLKSQ